MNKLKRLGCIGLCAALTFTSMSFSFDGSIAQAAKYVDYKPDKTAVAKEVLNVRANCSTKYKKVGRLEKNAKVTVYGYKKNGKEKWYKVKVGKKYGYVISKYMKITGTKPGKPGKPSEPQKPDSNGGDKTYIYTNGVKEGRLLENLNVRKGPGTGFAKIVTLKKGDMVDLFGYKVVGGEKWYQIEAKGQLGYISAEYVKNLGYKDAITEPKPENPKPQKPQNPKPEKPQKPNTDFEASLVSEGFPSSYKAALRQIHKEHPTWVFKAHRTNLDFDYAVNASLRPGRNVVSQSAPQWYRSYEEGTYNFATGKHKFFDAKWIAAHESVIRYYMDPRNFLDDTNIFMFLDNNFDFASQDANTIRTIVKGSFLETDEYVDMIYRSAMNVGVNANVLASSLLQEQGYKGTSGLISGTYPGYEGLYNFCNIGAYTTSKMSATERGLWYAKGGDIGNTSYGRPWDSKEKAIAGGAMYYKENYVDKNQNTLYTKKFNVMNGMASHEYMTNVAAAKSEASHLAKGMAGVKDRPLVFYIPVFTDMPSKISQLPSYGSNNNVLDRITVEGFLLNETFNRYGYFYTVTVPSFVNSVRVMADPNDPNASVSGTGTIPLTSGAKTVKINVTSTSGFTRTYNLTIIKG